MKKIATALAAVFLVPLVRAQLSFPDCVSQCVDQSSDNSCSITDVKCICRESNGRFLPDLVTCIHGECDSSLNIHQILDPLSTVCSMLGTPVSETALRNAELQASSLAAEATVTQTVTYTATGNVRPSPVGPATASITTGGEPLTVVTVTTKSDSGSTAAQTLPGTTIYTGLIPVVIVGTNGAGSVYTSTTTESGVISTIITTDSVGSTDTVVSTYTQAGGVGVGGVVVQTITTTNSAGSTFTTTQTSGQPSTSSSSRSFSSTTTAITSIAAQSTTGSFATSKTSAAPNTDSTNSSPFGYQSEAGQERVGSLFGMAMLFLVMGFWL